MANLQRLTVEFDITCSDEKFYGVFRNNMGLLIQLFPENFQRYKFHRGNEFGNGSVIIWNYNFGAPMTAILRHDTDDAAKTITFTVMGGELLETFKSFVEKLQIENGVAKWTIEFEKLNPSTPNPNEFLDLYEKFTRGLEAHLGNSKVIAQSWRVAAQFDIRCSDEKFYRAFRTNIGRLIQLIPENIKGYKIVQGNEFSNGTVIVWNYDLGNPTTVRVRQDTADAAKAITFTVVGGDVLETFKSFVVKLKVKRGAAKWSIEFEKLNPNTPNLNGYLDLYKKITREFDAYLGKAKNV